VVVVGGLEVIGVDDSPAKTAPRVERVSNKRLSAVWDAGDGMRLTVSRALHRTH
jgi:hypothetical protein